MGFRFSLGKENPQFNCLTCTEQENRNCLNHKGLPEFIRAVDKNYTLEQEDFVKEHKLRKVFPLKNKEEIIRMYECPVSYMTQDTRDIMQLCFSIESTGHLLHEGGLGSQPYWLIESMGIYKKELGLRDGGENARSSNKS